LAHAVSPLRRRGTSAVSRGAALYAAAGLTLLLVPAAWLVLEIGRNRASHGFAGMPAAGEIVRSLVPVRALGLLLPSLLLAAVLGTLKGFRRPTEKTRERD